MSSLTPSNRSGEATHAANSEGYVNGLLTLFPSLGALHFAMKNPTFVLRTNWQARTAMVLMPAVFVYSLTSEKKLEHKMKEIAQETRHNAATVQWAEQKLAQSKPQNKELHLMQLYQQSMENSGLHIVPGDSLRFYHKAANYVQENPIKMLVAMAVPSVALIFSGRKGKEHLEFSHKLLHTRVFGQFATLCILLGVMGFKEFMDSNGKYISQAEADARIEEMKRLREELVVKLESERKVVEDAQREIKQAHDEDLREKSKVRNKKD